MSLRKRILQGPLLSLIVTSSGLAQTPALVLRGATLIDGTDGPPQANATVVLKNGWIVAVGNPADVTIPPGARVIDLTGRYLLPGFIEMHGHVAIGAWVVDSSGGKRVFRYAYDEADTRELTKAQLAFGITTVRNPATPTREGVVLRNRVRLGEQVGPRIITSGAPIDGPSIITATDQVTTEAEIRSAVTRQAAAGVDFIKVYDQLDSAQIRIAVDEAHKHGLPVVGHLWRTSWMDASRAGIDGITHIIVSNANLLPEKSRAEFLEIKDRTRVMFDWFKYVDLGGSEIKGLLDTLVAHWITIDPTLVYFEQVVWGNDAGHYPEDAPRYVPPGFAAKTRKGAIPGWSAADYANMRDRFRRMQEFARRLYQGGVPLTVGTDTPNPWMYHREMELLAGAGIPNADVIRMATHNAAVALRLTSEIGSIEVGKRADLVVLDADPIADITNTRRIAWVIHDGKPARPEAYLPARLTRRGR
ncbi:MAG: amidohydrolase family protein [Gemmatimonadota bacterium]